MRIGFMRSINAKTREDGQALALFALFLFIFLGFTALSIDVGRYVWARTQMQAAVDAAALAGAQSMPNTSDTLAKATQYWEDNNDFIQANGYNINFAVTYPPGNKTVRVTGDADVSTWFARLFGVDHWHVSAFGDAESQVLDIAVVLDISGSMCNHPNLPSFPSVETGSAIMSPGRSTPAGGFAFPVLVDGDVSTPGIQGIPSSSATDITIELNDVRIFISGSSATNRSNFGDNWNSSTPYWQRSFSGVRAGMILIPNSSGGGYELFQILSPGPDPATNRMPVRRARANNDLGFTPPMAAHSVGAEIWANRYSGAAGQSAYCNGIAKASTGPTEPFDSAVSNSKYFISLFNSSYDKIGLASYSTTGTIRSNLTSNFSSLNTNLDAINYPDGTTNIAHGIARGRAILDGTGKRANAVRVMVVLTDGIPNRYCTNGYESASCSTSNTTDPSSCPASNTSITHAVNQAAVAAAADITVYTIGLGGGVLDCILQSIADAGGGEYFKAPSAADLDDAFQAIAEKTHIALVK